MAFTSRLGEFPVDLYRIAIAGHSAGGHLAILAGGGFQNVRAVIGLAAITDLKEYAGGNSSCQRVAPQLMGGTPAQFPGRYDQASPAVLGADVPVVLLQGGADGIVPPAQAQAFAGAEVVLLEEAGHFDLIHTRTPAFPKLIEVLKELFAQ